MPLLNLAAALLYICWSVSFVYLADEYAVEDGPNFSLPCRVQIVSAPFHCFCCYPLT